jgi:uncharacterized protein YeaO (DUF488 family)
LIHVKRVYDAPSPEDGFRILVDRLWPRGLKKEKAQVDLWLKDIAPSNILRKWYGHDPEKWDEFRKRYSKELEDQSKAVQTVLALLRQGSVTLLFSSRELHINNAFALKEYLESQTGRVKSRQDEAV